MASPCCNVLIREVKKKEPNCCSRKNPLINGLLKAEDRLLFDSEKQNVEKIKAIRQRLWCSGRGPAHFVSNLRENKHMGKLNLFFSKMGKRKIHLEMTRFRVWQLTPDSFCVPIHHFAFHYCLFLFSYSLSACEEEFFVRRFQNMYFTSKKHCFHLYFVGKH